MTEVGEQSESSRLEERIEVRIVESYSAADRSELAGGENDPSQTSAYPLQWGPTEKHVVVVAGGKTVCHVGFVGQTMEVQANPVSIAGIGGVLVRRGCRGRGYCRTAMGAAETFAEGQMRVKFILLFLQAGTSTLVRTSGLDQGLQPPVGGAVSGKRLASDCFDGQVFGSRAMAPWGNSLRVAALVARCVVNLASEVNYAMGRYPKV